MLTPVALPTANSREPNQRLGVVWIEARCREERGVGPCQVAVLESDLPAQKSTPSPEGGSAARALRTWYTRDVAAEKQGVTEFSDDPRWDGRSGARAYDLLDHPRI